MGPLAKAQSGSLRCQADTRDASFAWSGGMVRDHYRVNEFDRWFAGFAESDDATFLIAVEPADSLYTVVLTLGDPQLPRGPVSVIVNDVPFAEGIETLAGEKRQLSLGVEPDNGRIAIRLTTTDCRGFALGGVVVRGPAGARLGVLFPETALPDSVPDPATLHLLTESEACRLLRTLGDFLIKASPRQGGFSYHGAWYQNAYAIRTLMIGGRLLRQADWEEPALACLDMFVGQQGRNSNWLSSYTVRAECHSGENADSTSANLADIGSMTTTLALVASLVDGDRHRAYLHAAVNYADSISLPRQSMDGSFANGLYASVSHDHPYSVATACQTTSLAALFAATGEPRYRTAAERGARWLADNSIAEDGRFLLHRHNLPDPILRDASDFGNVFYVADALIMVRAITEDDSIRRAIDVTMDRWLFGPHGLASTTEHGYWWLPRDAWSNSKMGSMLYVLASYPHQDSPVIVRWIELGLAWLADPALRSLVGITRDPASLGGTYALPATGYAGLGVAAVLANRIPGACMTPVPVSNRE